jgi:MoaA/NifB/PqqE/SkfB family radical SAM enzyme
MSDLAYLHSTNKKYLFDGCKLLYHQGRLQDFLDGKRIPPIHIDMGIHKSCNIKCVYCYGVKQVPSPEFITEDKLLQLARDAYKVGVKSIAIIGDGEPTMNKGLYPFVEECWMHNVNVSVATNGLLLTDWQIETLTRSCTWIRFNISGVDNYEWVMGARPDSFARFEDRVKYAVAHKGTCTIGLQMVLIPECANQVIPLAKKAIEWGVDYLVVKQFSDGGHGMPLHVDMDAYAKHTDMLKQAEGMSNDQTSIIIKWSAINDSVSITRDGRWDFDRCIDLPFLFQISGNGKCYPCGYLFGNDNYCYGDVTKHRLVDILSGERYWEVIKKVANTPLEQLCLGQCRHCEGNKFVDRLTKVYAYTGDLEKALIQMCGSKEQYEKLLDNPPQHINYI